MATFTEVKADIADELNRTDLDTQIEKSLTRAITFYQSDRFWFSEERAESETEIGEAFYPLPSDFVKPITFAVVLDGRNYTLSPRPIDYLHGIVDSNYSSLPVFYSIIDQQIRLYPLPNQVYQIILHYYKEISLPIDDEETLWTMDIAEQLIRYRAKKEIYLNYLHDMEMFAAMRTLEIEIFGKMKERNVLHSLSGHLDKEESLLTKPSYEEL